MSNTYLHDLEKIGPGAVFAILTILLLISPGVAVVYVFLPELFVRLDTFKLLVLSASVVVPFVAAFFIPVSLWWMSLKPSSVGKSKKPTDTGLSVQFAGLLISTLIGSMLLYAMILVSKLASVSFGRFVILCALLTLLLSATLTLLTVKNSSVS